MPTEVFQNGAAYIRVSTDKQEELSPDAQKRLILDYAKKNHIQIAPSAFFLENGISGRKAAVRPAFLEMIARAKSKEHPFDVILVWKYSRFARNQEESIVYKSMLKRDNVEVISISEPLIDGPFGSLIERIIEWMDEYYSIRLSDEVFRGMTEKALRGGYQSAAPFGYDTVGGGNPPVINPTQAKIVRLIFSDFLSDKTYYSIAKNLNLRGVRTSNGNPFETRTIQYILENPFYVGKVRWNYTKRGRTLKTPSEWIVSKGAHEAIISEADWNRAQARIEALKFSPKRREISSCKHWLSGILKCSSCGASLGCNKNVCSPYFQCWKYTKGVCQTSHSVSVKKAEAILHDGLNASVFTAILSFQLPNAVLQKDNTEAELLHEQLKKISFKEKRIFDAYENGIDSIEEYRSKKLRLQAEKAALEKQISALTPAASSPAVDSLSEKTPAVYRFKSSADFFSSSDFGNEEKGAAVRSILNSVVYRKETEHFDFFFYLKKE